jgi:hypothetical protein
MPEAVVLTRKVKGKGKEKVPTQSKLEFGKAVEFTRDGILQAVAKFIACDNQVRQCLMHLMLCQHSYTGPDGCWQGTIPELSCLNVAEHN